MTLPSHPFWDYSLKIYRAEPVKTACLLLQDDFKLNVNVLLFCCWRADVGLSLTSRELQSVLQKIHRWHSAIVENLRSLRRSFKRWPASDPYFYEESLAQELLGENIEQLLMVESMNATTSIKKPLAQKSKEALSHLQTYLTLEKTNLSETGFQAVQMLIAGAFPQKTSQSSSQLLMPL